MNADIYSLLDVFTWIEEFVCLHPFLSLPFSLSRSASLSHTHTFYLFSHQSLRALQPVIVSQTGTRGIVWLVVLGVHTGEAGKAGHSSLQRRKSLSHIAAHIHPQNDRLSSPLSFLFFFNHPLRCKSLDKIACFLRLYLRLAQSAHALLRSDSKASWKPFFLFLNFKALSLLQTGISQSSLNYKGTNVLKQSFYGGMSLNSAAAFVCLQ